MLKFLQKKPTGQEIVFKIDGMHCVACSMNIDGALEDSEGVIGAETSYAKGETRVNYDGNKVKVEKLKQVIEGLGYKVKGN